MRIAKNQLPKKLLIRGLAPIVGLVVREATKASWDSGRARVLTRTISMTTPETSASSR